MQETEKIIDFGCVVIFHIENNIEKKQHIFPTEKLINRARQSNKQFIGVNSPKGVCFIIHENPINYKPVTF